MSQERSTDINRRQFNKAVFGWVGGLATLSVVGVGLSLIKRKDSSPYLNPEERYPKELELYGEKGIQLIDQIEKETGLIIPLPGTFTYTELHGKGLYRNSQWQLEELSILNGMTQRLPNKLQIAKGKRVVLGVVRSGEYVGVGGSSPALRVPSVAVSPIILKTPRNYDSDQPSSEPDIWQNAGEEFGAAFMHEMTHFALDKDTTFIREYAGKVGWITKGLGWVYKGPESRVIRLMEKMNEWGPKEDIAFASGIYSTNTRALTNTEGDFKRFSFLSNELYSGKFY